MSPAERVRFIKEDLANFQKLWKATQVLFSSLELDQILSKIISLAREVLDTDYASIVLVDEHGRLTRSVEDFKEVVPLERRARPTGLTSEIVKTQQPILVHDVKANHRSSNPVLVDLGIQSYIGVPLIVNNSVRGVLYAYSLRPRVLVGKLPVIMAFTGYASIALRNALLMEELKSQAIRDSLTGLYNYRYFNERVTEEIKRGERSHSVFSLLMFDLDNFKIYNDLHGHLIGDKILQQVADAIRSPSRSTDVVARYGGDEFVMLLPDTDKPGAVAMAQRIMDVVRALPFTSNQELPVNLTVSIGIATYPSDATSAHHLLDKADQEMFRAKRRGGNQISVYTEGSSGVEADILFENEILSNFMYALAHAIDLKDRSTSHHSQQVSRLAVEVAKRLDLPREKIEDIRTAALLHDIGKIGLSEYILSKPGRLTDVEWKEMKRHPVIGANLLNSIPNFERVATVIESTHEHYDGTGYPNGRISEEIPIGARIIGVVDAYCTLRSRRPFRAPMSHEDAISHLQENAGKEFDPRVVEVFVEFLKDRSLDS